MKKSSSRRTSHELLEDILQYLVNVDRPVNLNDIAIAIGSNTKLVKRWIELIYKIQNTRQVEFIDDRTIRYELEKTSSTDVDYRFAIFKSAHLSDFEISRWLSEKTPLLDDIWKFDSNIVNSELILYLTEEVNPSKEFYELPATILNSKGEIILNQQEAFFLINGYRATRDPGRGDKPGTNSILYEHIIDLLQIENFDTLQINTEIFYQMLIPLIPTSFRFEMTNHSELEFFLKSLVDIIRGYSSPKLEKYQLINPKLTIDERTLLSQSMFGKLALARMDYLIQENLEFELKIDPLPNMINTTNFVSVEILFWNILNLIETQHFQPDNYIALNLFDLLRSSQDPRAIVLANFMCHLVNKTERDFLQIDFSELEISSFYFELQEISRYLLRIKSNPNSMSSLGSLVGFQAKFQINASPYLRWFITRKLVAFGTHQALYGIFLANFLYQTINFTNGTKYSRLWQQALLGYLAWQFADGSIEVIHSVFDKLDLSVEEIIQESQRFQGMIIFYHYMVENLEFIKRWYQEIQSHDFKIMVSTKYWRFLRLALTFDRVHLGAQLAQSILEVMEPRSISITYFEDCFGPSLGVFVQALFDTSFVEIEVLKNKEIEEIRRIENEFVEFLPSIPLLHEFDHTVTNQLIQQILKMRHGIIHNVAYYKEELENIEILSLSSPLITIFYITCYSFSAKVWTNVTIRGNIRRFRNILNDVLESRELNDNGFSKQLLDWFEFDEISHIHPDRNLNYNKSELNSFTYTNYMKFSLLRELFRVVILSESK